MTDHIDPLKMHKALVQFIRTHSVDEIDSLIQHGEFGKEWHDFEGEIAPEKPGKWRDLVAADPSRPLWLGDGTLASTAVDKPSQKRDSAADRRRLRISLEGLHEIPRSLAQSLARTLDVSLEAAVNAAKGAKVAALNREARTRFQIPLRAYFDQVIGLPVDVTAPWKDATLAVQFKGDRLQVVLNSPPINSGLAISFDEAHLICLIGPSANEVVAATRHSELRLHETRFVVLPFSLDD